MTLKTIGENLERRLDVVEEFLSRFHGMSKMTVNSALVRDTTTQKGGNMERVPEEDAESGVQHVVSSSYSSLADGRQQEMHEVEDDDEEVNLLISECLD